MSDKVKDNKKGIIFNIQRFSLHDGPGIRTTIFFKGCPLRCMWCHNPEGINQFRELLYKSYSCIFCGNCIDSCHNNAIYLDNKQIIINRNDCDLCGKCTEVCQTNSLEICGKSISAEELINEALKDKDFYISSNGGVTISGGEPLFQISFLENLIKRLKKCGLHVCVDTSGYASTKKFSEILELVDMVLFDIKSLNDQRHKKLTGVSNKLILANLKECLNKNIEVNIRIPIIKGYNFINLQEELEDHITELIGMGFKNFEFIPYHRFGEQKYQMLGKQYEIKLDSNDIKSIKRVVDDLKKEHSVKIELTQPILT
ncbi:MAG: glycyl-radical enzyme activating protein [Candidatus Lokiarchaeota archaeon]|nr:glycyl-radical enzyme activating protein [Candidatus Lokiarchaeota archaeon]